MGNVYRRHRWVRPPICTHTASPAYSADALHGGIEGQVTLLAEIRTDGIAHNIRVIHGLGVGLDEQAVDCLRHWTFLPALDRDANPVSAVAQFGINFSLRNSK